MDCFVTRGKGDDRMVRTILLDGRKIEYEFQRKRVRNLNLRVRADGSVAVSAATGVPMAAVEAFLQSQAGRILRAIDRASPPLQPVLPADGTQLSVFGEPVTVRWRGGSMPSAVLGNGILTLTLCDPADEAERLRIFGQWRSERCKAVFDRVCDQLILRLAEYRVERPTISVRTMSSRWGSCRPQKQAITLNLRLMEYPVACTEFVVMHELVHLVHPNHSAQFYGLLSSVMPDWRERKRLQEQTSRKAQE